jgi:hypothetical protein
MAGERTIWGTPVLSQIRACWMCGTQLPAAQLIADGSAACADIRWYCRDVQRCTDRWTARRPSAGSVPVAQAASA